MATPPQEARNTANESDRPLLDLEGGPKDGAKAVAKFANSSKRFRGNVLMAVSIALYMTLFGLPVFSTYISDILFGQKDVVVGSKVVSCGPHMMGLQVNAGTKSDPILADYTRTHVKEGIKPVAWCGFLPSSYFGVWPAVVTTAMLTLVGTTGSTVMNAWRCMCGTFFAVLNTYMMTALFPEGGADPNYSPFLGWANLVGVLFLFLTSKVQPNTMMMGMSTTVCLQLHFMDPVTGPTVGQVKSAIPGLNWDGETTMQIVTKVVGCAIAIAATLVPVPLLNIAHVHEDAEEIIRGVDIIFQDSIKYYCGEAPGARRFQIFGKMIALKGGVRRVGGNLSASFWETFNLGKYAKVRELYGSFNKSILDTEDVLYAIKAALIQLDFNEHHGKFVRALRAPLNELHVEVVKCLTSCTKCCKDGVISQDEQEEIAGLVAKIGEKQREMCTAFEEVANNCTEELISPDIASDSLFVFAISQWASELQDWAKDIAQSGSKGQSVGKRQKKICEIALTQIKGLFDPSHMFAKDQLIFFLMNALPILAGFAISMFVNGSIFIQYSPIMPGLLSLLVSSESGATFFINLQKLMGVTFGRTLPLLVMSVVDFLDCDSYFRFGLHAVSTFVFLSMFTFMRYASEQWSTIGMMIAAFGCGTLFRPCSSHAGLSNASYAEQYKGIAEVIVAMIMKMVSEFLFSPTPPRDIAVQKIETLFSQIEGAFRMISAHEIETPDVGVMALVAKAKASLAACEAQAPKTDSKLEVVQGARTSFKKELYESALTQARLIISDLDMLSLALHGHVTKHALEDTEADSAPINNTEAAKESEGMQQEQKWVELLTSCEAWAAMDKDILDTISSCFSVCLSVLKHDTEEPLEGEHITKLEEMSNLAKLDGLSPFYKQVSEKAAQLREMSTGNFMDQVTSLPKTRILLAVNALGLAVTHVSEVAAHSFAHMLYA